MPLPALWLSFFATNLIPVMAGHLTWNWVVRAIWHVSYPTGLCNVLIGVFMLPLRIDTGRDLISNGMKPLLWLPGWQI